MTEPPVNHSSAATDSADSFSDCVAVFQPGEPVPTENSIRPNSRESRGMCIASFGVAGSCDLAVRLADGEMGHGFRNSNRGDSVARRRQRRFAD